MFDGPLQSLLNGQQAEHISLRDRGFQYGDGCFETVRVRENKLVLWPSHLERLKHGCKVLQMSIDFDLLEKEVAQILEQNPTADSILKVIVTRGEGGRGYGIPEQPRSNRVLQLTNYKPPNTDRAARVVLCQHRLSSSVSLAGLKHLNRLDQVLASTEIPAECDEGLCMDEDGFVIEGCRSNLLLAIDDEIITPKLSRSGVKGVMLTYLTEYLSKTGTHVQQKEISLTALKEAKEIILCNSVFGIWSIAEIQNQDWQRSSQQLSQGDVMLELQRSLFQSGAQ